ncbi:MAG: ABC transporter permease, partial [Clostridiales bacterium]|nr:ABC transporter permease [Clostridiales bacterium]
VLSKFFVQTLLAVLQSFIMAGIFSLLIGMPEGGILAENPFFEVWVTVFLTIEASMALGFIVSSLVKSGDKAMTLAPFVLIVQLLFSGILFELEGAGEKIAYFTISKWSVEALGSIVDMNSLPNRLGVLNEAKDIYDPTAAHLFSRWGILAVMLLICGIGCTLLLRSLSRDSR